MYYSWYNDEIFQGTSLLVHQVYDFESECVTVTWLIIYTIMLQKKDILTNLVICRITGSLNVREIQNIWWIFYIPINVSAVLTGVSARGIIYGRAYEVGIKGYKNTGDAENSSKQGPNWQDIHLVSGLVTCLYLRAQRFRAVSELSGTAHLNNVFYSPNLLTIITYSY